jgi:proteic killer suppression protein
MDIFDVRFAKLVTKQLEKLPQYIVDKLYLWVDQVADEGLFCTRKISGYHDEPLKGARKHQRSIRLSRSYRAIYEIKEDCSVEFIEVEEVTKHEY